MFGELLSQKMKEKSMRLKDLSILTDITEGYLSDIKNDNAVPKRDKFEVIVKVLNLTPEEKDQFLLAWERDSSPLGFVKRYDNLVTENEYLKKVIDDAENTNVLLEQLKVQKKINDTLEKQKNRYKLYADLFNMMQEQDKVYMLKLILLQIENSMREQKIFTENKKEFDDIKRGIEALITR